MRTAGLAALVTIAFASAPARADERARVDAFLWNTSPVALETGLVTGGAVDARWLLGRGFFVGGGLGVGDTEEATSEWVLDDVDLLARATGGVEAHVGSGILFAELGVGALAIRQNGERAQFQRLQQDGVPNLTRDSWSVGPYASLDLGAEVSFFDSWALVLRLGPAFTMQKVAGEVRSRWLFSTGLGVSRGF